MKIEITEWEEAAILKGKKDQFHLLADPQPFIDFPTGFRIQEEYKDLTHDPKCSFIQGEGGFLCDCCAIYEPWRQEQIKNRLVFPIGQRVYASQFEFKVTKVDLKRIKDVIGGDSLLIGLSESPYWKPGEVDENPKPTHEWKEPYFDDFYFWTHYPEKAYLNMWRDIKVDPNSWIWILDVEDCRK